jgi:hypothetical protein
MEENGGLEEFMARPFGTSTTKSILTLYIPGDWVFKAGRKRYVFLEALYLKIHQLLIVSAQNKVLYNRFSQLVRRDVYNIIILHGVRALDIDHPQDDKRNVSIALKIIVGEGQDSLEIVS